MRPSLSVTSGAKRAQPLPSASALLPSLLLLPLLLLLLLTPAFSAPFGTFLTQYTLPSTFSAVALGVGASGTLYVLSPTRLLSYPTPSSLPSTSSTNFTAATWLAAQPTSDLLLVADAGAGNFVFVTNSALILAPLTGFTSPRACGFVTGNRVVVVDRTSPTVLRISSITIGQVAGTSFVATYPAALGSQVGFTTDYADAYAVLSLSEGVIGYDLTGATVFTYLAPNDNSIAFIRAALASDTLGHLFLAQSTIASAINAQLIAITVSTDALVGDSQQGVINGVGAASISGGFIALDNSGTVYALNRVGGAGGYVQALAGLNLTSLTGIPPLTPSTPGYYLGQILTDNSTAGAIPLGFPLSVAFDATGQRYISDSGNARVVVQTAGGAFVRSITTDGAGHPLVDPQVVRVQGNLLYISELSGAIVIVYTNGTAYSTITKDDQGAALSPNTLIGFDVDASGHLIIPEVSGVQAGGTVNVRIFALTDKGVAVPGSSFTVTGIPNSQYPVEDLVVDRTLNVAYVAYASGTIVAYSLNTATLGQVVHTYTTWGSANPFQSINGLALDAFGHLYVADLLQGVIVLTASTGAYVTNFQGVYAGSPDVMTYSVTVEPSTGHVFMTDTSLNRVVILQGFTAAITPASSSSAAVPIVSSSTAASATSAAAATSAPTPSTAAVNPTSAAVTPAPSSSSTASAVKIVGDPQFTGFRGQSFQVHGIDGHVYSLISEPHLQVNSRFVFLTQGRCPTVDGKPGSNCWSHPGSYMGSVSFQHRGEDGETHRVLVEAGGADDGFARVECDGVALDVDESDEAGEVVVGGMTVVRSSSHAVSVRTPHFEFALDNSDGFLNQAVGTRVSLAKLRPHGLLGQTWQMRRSSVEGKVEDYSQQHDDLFGADDVFNRFAQPAADSYTITTTTV